MSDIDWSKAPDGTTHINPNDGCNPWRRIEDDVVYAQSRGKWTAVRRTTRRDYIARPPVSERPLRAEEFDHLVEPDWSKAPEGATHYNKRCPYPWLRDGDIVAYFADERGWRDYGAPAGGRRAVNEAVPRPKLPDAVIAFDQKDPDAAAAVEFAQAMGARLATCRAAGRSGWDDPEQCPPQRLAEGLVRAVRAGKLVDVGNYAMMLWMRTYGRELPPSAPIAGWIGEALERREPVEWDGTGLPPVGTVCGFDSASFEGDCESGPVIGYDGELVIVRIDLNPGGPFYTARRPGDLRPILTPEQRAAKERDEAVAAMLADADVVPFGSEREEVMARALYDAGWRKMDGE